MIDKRRNRNKVILIIVIVLFMVGVIYLLLPLNSKITVINEDLKTVSFKHDSTWKLKQKSDNLILLKNSGDSQLKIQITKINNEFKYSSINELVDELMYNIQSQNKGFKLISEKRENITANMYDSYKFLYENNNEQVMVVVYKIGDKLISYIYEASNDYFDILLDSVNSIINSLTIKDETYELSDSIKLNLADISYSTNSEFDKLLNESKSYKTAHKNYLVEYDIPSIFNISNIDSSNGYYEYINDDKKIELTFHIYNQNIYKYFDEDESGNIYSSYSYYRNNPSYTNYVEKLNKYESKYDSYIYKCSYNDKSIVDDTERTNEIVRLLFAIDNKHTVDIEITALNIPITEKLISMIKINKVTNYSSYVLNNKEGNNIVGEFKAFTNYKHDKIYNIKLLLPDKYKEIDFLTTDNIYTNRYYRLNYDETYDLYDYEVDYVLNNTVGNIDDSIKFAIESINSVYIKSIYGKSQKMTFTKKMNINGKEFFIYDGGYTDRSGVMLQSNLRKDYYINKKVLFYKISDNFYLEININGNDKKISDNMLREVTNFTITEENI